MSTSKMKINIRKSAIRDLKNIEPKQKDKLHKKILSLKSFPKVSGIKKLTKFEPAYRLRVGDYRILFDVESDIIIIGRVLHRRESYR